MISVFSDKIINWYKIHGRKKLPWQIKKTPYKIWISEIMLQQTQMARVIPYFKRFIHEFPNINKLATSELNIILYFWSGLGYYTRAHNLYKTAKIIVNRYHASFPTNFNTLITLPGIGRSTAGAILSLALEKKQPILDSNVKRILTRYHTISGWPGNNKIEKKLWNLIEDAIPNENVSEFNQGLMDLGEIICTTTHPKCNFCPLENTCQANLKKLTLIYPTKKPKIIIQKKNIWLLILQYEHKVWIEKCALGKIWQGLFCFPQFNTKYQLYNWLTINNLDHHLNQHQTLPIVQHTLSQYHMYITPIIFHLNKILHFSNRKNTGFWFDFTTPKSVGFPQPMLKLLQQINLF